MCAFVLPAIIGAAVGLYGAHEQRKDAAAAREQTERQMQMAREQAASPMAASESSSDVTAAVQANRKRAAAAYGMSNTITGAGTSYGSGLGVGTKQTLGA